MNYLYFNKNIHLKLCMKFIKFVKILSTKTRIKIKFFKRNKKITYVEYDVRHKSKLDYEL